MSNKPGYLYMYNPQTGQFEWVKQPIEGTPQPIENTTLSEFLGSFSGSDSFDLSNIVGSFGKSIGNMSTSQSSIGSTDNLQANWGIQDSIANNVRDKVSQREESLKNSFLDKATTGFGNTFSSDPFTAESAKNKITDFLNGKSGSIKGGSSGMSKDPSAYMTAATDIAKFSSDIADSAKSKMSLPSQYNYNSNNVRDIYGHSQFFKSAGVPMSFAGKRPNFINSFTDVNKKLIKGAMDGYNISNNWIGALIGGVVGAGLGIGNTFAKLHTYNQNKYRIGRYNDINDRNYNLAQRDIQSNIWSTNNNIMNLQRTANIGALGGQIDNSEIAGVTTFNTGGTHETNPNGGIPQGIGENGKPNLVEEGEVKWNDFIFSKRIKPQDDILKQYNSFFKGGVASYADAATKILDMHKERENNPFDIATLNVQMRRLADAQEYQKIAEEAAQYGLLPEEYMQYQQQATSQNTFPEGGRLLYYDAIKHEIVDNQPEHNQWVPIQSGKSGKNYSGLYNYNSPFYDEFWNRLTPEEQRVMKEQFKDWYFSDEYVPAYQFGTQTRYNKWPNKNITIDELYNQAINNTWGSVHQAWVDWMVKAMNDKKEQANVPYLKLEPKTLNTVRPEITNRERLPESVVNTTPTNNTNPRYPYYLDLLRAAPVLSNLHSILTQNAPDYTYANQLKSLYRPATYQPVGQYQRYQPVDQHYLDTQAQQQRNTQYGFYKNNAQSNAISNYLASVASAQHSAAVNDAYIRALQTNNQNRNAALQYNNTLDQWNEQNRRDTQNINNTNYANIMSNAYRAAEEERLAVEHARETNMMNFAQNLGNLGQEMYDRWRINHDPSLSYTTGWKYKEIIPYLNAWAEWTKEYNKNNQTT